LKSNYFSRICQRHLNFAVVAENLSRFWKSRGARSNPGHGSIELQKKRLNTLKALKRAQKCTPPKPRSSSVHLLLSLRQAK
jgi:hypothetical protein